jgi:microsomal epoxide hydrolase
MRWLSAIAAMAGLIAGLAGQAVARSAAPAPPAVQDRFFLSSDHIQLHYLDAGHGHTIVFIPGWTMPAWIFDRQIAYFARHYHVVAFDPRGQGDSTIAAGGYTPGRRGQDIADLISQLGPQPVLLVGWSLGVLDTLAYIHSHGDQQIAGLVLVDNSVGEEPPPPYSPPPPVRRHVPPVPRAVAMRRFVDSMFHTRQPAAYLAKLTATALRTPPEAARALLAYPVPRSYWKEAVYATHRPVLYIVRPGLSGQAGNLQAHRPDTESVVLHGVGHALFVDDAARFDALVQGFIHRRVWP